MNHRLIFRVLITLVVAGASLSYPFAAAAISWGGHDAGHVHEDMANAAGTAGTPLRIAIFVNGNGDCCAGEMATLRGFLREQGFRVYVSPWNSLNPVSGATSENQAGKVTAGATRNFVSQMQTYIAGLPANAELYLIGHSFGGDSLLSFLSTYRRSRGNIRLVAVLDAVGFGGVRSTGGNVGNNVEYFFNRWQTNAPWPVNFSSSGRVACSAKTCDQAEQNISRNPDGSARHTKCQQYENCPGKKIIYQGLKTRIDPGQKQTRLHHQYVPTDPLIESQLVNIIGGLMAGR